MWPTGERTADFVIERTFRVGLQEQLYIELRGHRIPIRETGKRDGKQG